jgi:hypothetical protein
MFAISSCDHLQFVGGQTIDAEQQPPAQLLIDRMMAVADGRLRHLCDQCLGIAQQ